MATSHDSHRLTHWCVYIYGWTDAYMATYVCAFFLPTCLSSYSFSSPHWLLITHWCKYVLGYKCHSFNCIGSYFDNVACGQHNVRIKAYFKHPVKHLYFFFEEKMALHLHILSWALIFILRLRIPPDKSLATYLTIPTYLTTYQSYLPTNLPTCLPAHLPTFCGVSLPCGGIILMFAFPFAPSTAVMERMEESLFT